MKSNTYEIEVTSSHPSMAVDLRPTRKLMPWLVFAGPAWMAASSMSLMAQEDAPWHGQPSVARDLWSLAELYKNDDHPFLQELALRGRYQGQYWHAENDGDGQSGWEDRRSRIGFDALLWERRIAVRADFQSNDGFKDFYDGMVDAYIQWRADDGMRITAGKTKSLIGHYDWLEPSLTQPTLERSQIFKQLQVGRATGLTIEKAAGGYSWRLGAYSNDAPNSTGGSGSFGDGEFGNFKGGASFSIGAGYDFAGIISCDKADFRIDWLHSERDPADDRVLNRYDDIVSMTFWIGKDPWDLVWEAYHASGGDGDFDDVFGFFIQPGYEIMPGRVHLVARYAWFHSAGEKGLVAPPRYEMPVALNGGLGDDYHSIYFGAQYFLHGHRLKLMAGAEQAWLRGGAVDAYKGYTLMGGIRLYF